MLEINYLIQDKLGLKAKDVNIILNNKRIEKEYKISYYQEKARDNFDKKMRTKEKKPVLTYELVEKLIQKIDRL